MARLRTLACGLVLAQVLACALVEGGHYRPPPPPPNAVCKKEQWRDGSRPGTCRWCSNRESSSCLAGPRSASHPYRHALATLPALATLAAAAGTVGDKLAWRKKGD